MGPNVAIVLLFVLGLGLIVAEIILPGVILGVIGLGCTVGAIIWAFQSGSLGLGITLLAISVAAAPLLFLLWSKIFARRFVSSHTQAGYTSAQMDEKSLLGQEGVAVTQLRPAGMARFAGKKVDVISEGEVIDPDTRVRVVEVKGNRVVVRPVRA